MQELRALGLVFSARKRGNCLDSIEYVLARLKENGFETDIVNAYDYEIKPCSHCQYECFAQELRGKGEECPIHDDVPLIYDKMGNSDIVLIAVPTYGGRPASLYSAFQERAQTLATKSYESIMSKFVALIVIGNVPAGGDLAYHTVVSDHLAFKCAAPSILLQSTEYAQRSINGTLIKDKLVTSRLDCFTKLILKRCRERGR
jgi:multimeric flavodoxin WrbA